MGAGLRRVVKWHAFPTFCTFILNNSNKCGVSGTLEPRPPSNDQQHMPMQTYAGQQIMSTHTRQQS
eukprot:4226157-Lingulodinium_polyedra.AAC.1